MTKLQELRMLRDAVNETYEALKAYEAANEEFVEYKYSNTGELICKTYTIGFA